MNPAFPAGPGFALYRYPSIYDELYDRFSEDIPFFRDLALDAGGPVLELACGSGRVTVPLARAGLEITGLDSSPEMIRAAEARARSAGVLHESHPGTTPRFVRGDMRDPAPMPALDPGGVPRGYALACIPLHSLSHLSTDRDITRCLRAVASVLKPGGELALAVHNPDPVVLRRDPDALYPVTLPGAGFRRSGDTLLESTRYDRDTEILHVRWWPPESRGAATATEATGATESKGAAGAATATGATGATGATETAEMPNDGAPCDFSLRMLFPRTLDLLLRGAGFSLIRRWGWYDRTEFSRESGTQVVLARSRA